MGLKDAALARAERWREEHKEEIARMMEMIEGTPIIPLTGAGTAEPGLILWPDKLRVLPEFSGKLERLRAANLSFLSLSRKYPVLSGGVPTAVYPLRHGESRFSLLPFRGYEIDGVKARSSCLPGDVRVTVPEEAPGIVEVRNSGHKCDLQLWVALSPLA